MEKLPKRGREKTSKFQLKQIYENLLLNKDIENLEEAGSIYINQLVYDQKGLNVDVTTLSLGEAFFDLPLFDFKKLDLTKSNHYSDSQGLPELRKKICEYYF